MGTPERQWSARMAQHKNIYAGCSKRPFSKAAASEEARRTLRYVEPLSDARTPLADFFSILLETRRVCFRKVGYTTVSVKSWVNQRCRGLNTVQNR